MPICWTCIFGRPIVNYIFALFFHSDDLEVFFLSSFLNSGGSPFSLSLILPSYFFFVSVGMTFFFK